MPLGVIEFDRELFPARVREKAMTTTVKSKWPMDKIKTKGNERKEMIGKQF